MGEARFLRRQDKTEKQLLPFPSVSRIVLSLPSRRRPSERPRSTGRWRTKVLRRSLFRPHPLPLAPAVFIAGFQSRRCAFEASKRVRKHSREVVVIRSGGLAVPRHGARGSVRPGEIAIG